MKKILLSALLILSSNVFASGFSVGVNGGVTWDIVKDNENHQYFAFTNYQRSVDANVSYNFTDNFGIKVGDLLRVDAIEENDIHYQNNMIDAMLTLTMPSEYIDLTIGIGMADSFTSNTHLDNKIMPAGELKLSYNLKKSISLDIVDNFYLPLNDDNSIKPVNYTGIGITFKIV